VAWATHDHILGLCNNAPGPMSPIMPMHECGISMGSLESHSVEEKMADRKPNDNISQ
jgi:hypothetical protein